MTQLPTSEEYGYIRMVAEQYLDDANAISNQELKLTIDFPPEASEEHWAFRIIVSEVDVEPSMRQQWVYEGSEAEIQRAVSAQ